MKKVSADTITDITAAAATKPGAGGTPPTAEEMIDSIRAALAARANALFNSEQHAQNIAPPDKKDQPTAFQISYATAADDLAQFEKIVSNVPNGFRLVPVLYTTINHQQNAQIYSQFTSSVRRRFLSYLADNHAEELEALGICKKGIKHMAQGHKPVDENNRPYDVNIDHIIERFGGGTASLKTEVDPLMPPGSKPTHLTNHFNNLILMPRDVHEMKNKLNELQGASRTPYGTSQWVLMIVPVADATHAGYVSQPQTTPLAAPSHGNNSSGQNRNSPLQDIFNETSRLNRLIDEAIRMEGAQVVNLTRALKSMGNSLKIAFNAAAYPRDIRDFKKFYEGKNFTSVRDKLEELPAEETADLRKTLQWLDTALSQKFNDIAANDNSSPRPQHKSQKKEKHGKKQRRNNNRRRHGQH